MTHEGVSFWPKNKGACMGHYNWSLISSFGVKRTQLVLNLGKTCSVRIYGRGGYVCRTNIILDVMSVVPAQD